MEVFPEPKGFFEVVRIRAIDSREADDWAIVDSLHRSAGYGYELPERNTVSGLHFAEEDGRVIAAAGLQLCAQLFAVVNLNTSPLTRLDGLHSLYAPLASAMLDSGAREVYAFADPRFKNFGGRLMRDGWSKKLWPCYYLKRKEIVAVYGTPDNKMHP